jgi:hypothetical protein
MKIMIAVPTHDSVPALFTYDLAQMMAFTAANFVGPDQPIESLGLTFATGTYVHSARNQLSQMAVESGADYVLWLDSDMRFPKETLARLLMHKQDIVGINYSTRGVPPSFVAIKSIKPRARLETRPDSTGLETVDAIGFGGVLVRTAILAQLLESSKTPIFWFSINEDGGMVGEDVYFCILAREAGYEIHVDHDLSQECAHIGQFEYRAVHPLAMQDEA